MNPYEAFERDVNDLLGDEIQADDETARAMWSALANVNWLNERGDSVGYSFRVAGDLIAAIRGSGDYMDWYCCGPYAIVRDDIRDALATKGWRPKELA